MSVAIRDLVPDDAPAVAAIFNSAIAKRLATFDEEPVPVAEIEAGLRADLPHYPGIAVTLDSVIVAYASSSPHSTYEPSRGIAEFSVYVAEAYCGRDLVIVECLLEGP